MTEIYKTICNICNLIYIGKHKINNRLSNNYVGSGKKFRKHIKEHGKDNFTKQIILYCEDKDVKYYEEKFIELYNATNPEIGLNISKKSKGLHKFSKEHKEKIGKSNTGKKQSKKAREKNRQSHLGIKFSKEHKEKIGKSNSKSIIAYKDDDYVEIFKSIKQAEIKLNLKSPNICGVLKGRQKFAGGFYFEYVT